MKKYKNGFPHIILTENEGEDGKKRKRKLENRSEKSEKPKKMKAHRYVKKKIYGSTTNNNEG